MKTIRATRGMQISRAPLQHIAWMHLNFLTKIRYNNPLTKNEPRSALHTRIRHSIPASPTRHRHIFIATVYEDVYNAFGRPLLLRTAIVYETKNCLSNDGGKK